jgi:hypothetical protein
LLRTSDLSPGLKYPLLHRYNRHVLAHLSQHNHDSMASVTDTESTLTSAPENLTELHARSGLQTEHQSQRTRTGYRLAENVFILYFLIPPHKKASTSWIWNHSERVTTRVDLKRCWMCRRCDSDAVGSLTSFTYLAAPASTADNERLFSCAGDVVNEDQPHTQCELAQATQCLRNWYPQGIIP